jgi:hypothetical protein
MVQKVYTIRDTKAKAFLNPFFTVNDDTAVRIMQNVVADENHEFNKNADDYSLYYLGEYDDNTGLIDAGDEPEYMIGLNQLKLENKVRAELEE